MTWCQFYKTFFFIPLDLDSQSKSVCPWQAFPAYLQEKSGAMGLQYRLQAIPDNSEFGWKVLQGRNILLYMPRGSAIKKISFITFPPDFKG
jgi:hypothetical protein